MAPHHCAGGSPGKLQEVLWPYSEPAFKGVGQPVRTLKLSAHEERSQETHECDCNGPMQLGTSTAVQHAVYHGLSSVQSCAMRPPASLSSQVETTLLRRLATLNPGLHDLQGTTLRLLSVRDIRKQVLCRCAPGLASSAPVGLRLSDSRTQIPWQASADPTAAAPHV